MIYHGLAAFALLVVLVGAVVASLAWTKPVVVPEVEHRLVIGDIETRRAADAQLILNQGVRIGRVTLPDDPDALRAIIKAARKGRYFDEWSPRGSQARNAWGRLHSESGGPPPKKHNAAEFDLAAMAERLPGGDVAFHYVHDYTPAIAELADENTTYCDAWGRADAESRRIVAETSERFAGTLSRLAKS